MWRLQLARFSTASLSRSSPSLTSIGRPSRRLDRTGHEALLLRPVQRRDSLRRKVVRNSDCFHRARGYARQVPFCRAPAAIDPLSPGAKIHRHTSGKTRVPYDRQIQQGRVEAIRGCEIAPVPANGVDAGSLSGSAAVQPWMNHLPVEANPSGCTVLNCCVNRCHGPSSGWRTAPADDEPSSVR